MRPGPTTGCASFAQGELPLPSHPRWAPAAPGCSKATAARARPGGTRVCAGSGANRTLRRHPGLCRTATAAQQAQPGAGAAGGQRRWGCAPTKSKRRNCWTTAPCGWACCWTALRPCSASRPTMPASKTWGQDVGVIHIAPDAGARPRAPRRCGARFAAPMGNPEDPVTGSLNASLAQWLIGEARPPPATWWRKANAWAGLAGCTSARMPRGRSGWAATP